jgi:long-chain fatty acid transport protein
LPAGFFGPGSPGVAGSTVDEKGFSPIPALAMVWGKPESKHTFAVSAFGVSGAGVDYPAETNLPTLGPNWDPTNSNPAVFPQTLGGFGHVTSNYMLLQVGVAYAYQLSEKVSIGIQPILNYGSLQVGPNPLASPSMTKGYPEAEAGSSLGYGGQVGIFYNSGMGFKLGASYKSTQNMGDMTLKNTYLDGSEAPDVIFKMDAPAIISAGVGYSNETFDFALDFRYVDYENTAGFEETGWSQTASVKGFGWKNMTIISTGIQYKGIDKFPMRVGYTYSSNPVDEKYAMFSLTSPGIIKNAFQVGLGWEITENMTFNGVYHHGSSGDATVGELLSPRFISANNPDGAIPGSRVAYNMTTDLVMIGISYQFNKK